LPHLWFRQARRLNQLSQNTETTSAGGGRYIIRKSMQRGVGKGGKFYRLLECSRNTKFIRKCQPKPFRLMSGQPFHNIDIRVPPPEAMIVEISPRLGTLSVIERTME